MSLDHQRKVIELFNNLFASGFHLGEIVDFLRRSQLLADRYTQVLSDGLLAGKPFSSLLADLRFSDAVVTQVSLAEVHGNTSLSLFHIQSYLENVSKIRKKLIEVATYPVILLAFLLLIVVGLKNYLLPQLEEKNIATVLINHLPAIFFIRSFLIIGRSFSRSYLLSQSEQNQGLFTLGCFAIFGKSYPNLSNSVLC